MRLKIVKKNKGALSGLRQFSTNESPLKMMKNAFYPQMLLYPQISGKNRNQLGKGSGNYLNTAGRKLKLKFQLQ